MVVRCPCDKFSSCHVSKSIESRALFQHPLKSTQSKLENDNRNSALFSILFDIWHEDNLSQGQRTTNAKTPNLKDIRRKLLYVQEVVAHFMY